MRKLTATVLAGAAALAAFTTIQAQNGPPQLPGQMDVGRVAAGMYHSDKGHSLVGWRVNHFGFNDYFGIFGDVDGMLEIDPKNISAAKVDVNIPIASVVVASAGLKDHLTRAGKEGGKPDFFGPNPTAARFVSTKVESTGGTTANITGNLTMNGVTKPITIAAEFTGAGNSMMGNKATIGFEGRAVLKRSDWGIGFAVPMVSDEVELDISTAWEKQ
ncbi:YceI family protein [Tsuneonella sp. HG222]